MKAVDTTEGGITVLDTQTGLVVAVVKTIEPQLLITETAMALGGATAVRQEVATGMARDALYR